MGFIIVVQRAVKIRVHNREYAHRVRVHLGNLFKPERKGFVGSVRVVQVGFGLGKSHIYALYINGLSRIALGSAIKISVAVRDIRYAQTARRSKLYEL